MFLVIKHIVLISALFWFSANLAAVKEEQMSSGSFEMIEKTSEDFPEDPAPGVKEGKIYKLNH